MGVLDTEVTDYPGSGIEGSELLRSPSISGDLGMSYVHEQGFQASLDARYASSYYSDLFNDPRGETEPYWIANAQLGYAFMRESSAMSRTCSMTTARSFCIRRPLPPPTSSVRGRME